MISEGSLRIGRSATPVTTWTLIGSAAALVIAGRLAGIGHLAEAQTFVLIFTSIVAQALPFVALGAFVSAALEVYVPATFFRRVGSLPVALQVPAAAVGGFAFPVCECGSVPVARRLMIRGTHPAAAVTFMIASAILNPIVLASTWVAYRGFGLGGAMVVGRAGLGLLLAMAIGWALGTDGASELLRARRDEQQEHDHTRTSGRHREFVEHLSADIVFMGRFLVAGAALAAALQTIVPQSVVAGIARTPVLGSLALMAIAFVLSLCSEADAFVAVSFTQFPLSSQLAFLTFGPALDLKLAFLYSATFRKRFVLRLLLVAVPVVLAGSLWFQVVTS